MGVSVVGRLVVFGLQGYWWLVVEAMLVTGSGSGDVLVGSGWKSWRLRCSTGCGFADDKVCNGDIVRDGGEVGWGALGGSFSVVFV